MFKIVRHKNNKNTLKNCKGIPKRTRKGIQEAFLKMRVKLKKDTIADMKKKKSGKLYWVKIGRNGSKLKRGRWHQASKRGESPAILSGALKRSLGYTQQYGRELTFGADTPYARRHELRGQRSYLLRSIRKNRRDMKRWFTNEIGRSLHKVAI